VFFVSSLRRLSINRVSCPPRDVCRERPDDRVRRRVEGTATVSLLLLRVSELKLCCAPESRAGRPGVLARTFYRQEWWWWCWWWWWWRWCAGWGLASRLNALLRPHSKDFLFRFCGERVLQLTDGGKSGTLVQHVSGGRSNALGERSERSWRRRSRWFAGTDARAC